jgi:hypothetical protein
MGQGRVGGNPPTTVNMKHQYSSLCFINNLPLSEWEGSTKCIVYILYSTSNNFPWVDTCHEFGRERRRALPLFSYMKIYSLT